MAIREVGMSTAPVLLKESDIPEAGITGRKQVELEKIDLLFWKQSKCYRESTACKIIDSLFI